MRVIILFLCLAAIVGGAYLALSDEGKVAPSALQILRDSDAAMDMTSIHVEVEIDPLDAGQTPLKYWLEIVNGRCVRSSLAGAGCSCASQPQVWPYFDRAEGGTVYGDQLTGATAAEKVRIVGEDVIDGQETWVVAYEFQNPSIEGPFRVERKEWIGKLTQRLLRQEETNHDPFGVPATIRSEIAGLAGFESPCPKGSG